MTHIEYNELAVALARHYDGAHSHTASKADFYLKKLVDKPKAKFSNCSADEFISSVRMALHSNEWEQLAKLMGRWW